MSDSLELAPGVTSTPGVRGGRPCVAGKSLPSYLVAGRFAAGESITHIATDYGMTTEAVEDALRWEGWLRHRVAGRRKAKEGLRLSDEYYAARGFKA